jgi:cell wall-associated NlpC family hydrolase
MILPGQEATERARMIAEARSWLGTPFHWCADKKGIGVDCAMLLVRCAVDAGILPPFDPRPYPSQWHLHQNEERFLGWIERAGAVPVDEPQPGDIGLWRFGRCFSHGCIVIEPGMIVHAHLNDRIVTLAKTDDAAFWLTDTERRPVRWFDPWRGR